VRRNYYVYFHRDGSGSIFYVGKGTGRRAWSEDRHPTWRKYVSERLYNRYSVEIHKDGLSESEADELEDSLIAEFGVQLINWVNPGRGFDYHALAEYHKLRDANRAFVAATRPLEKSDLSQAIARYRQALTVVREYESITLERGIVAEMNCGPNWGDPNILDRLTMCLVKAGRHAEALDEAARYFADFLSVRTLAVGKRIEARVAKLEGR
jgi:hypothetical protein